MTRYLTLPLILAATVFTLNGCKSHEKIDLSSIHTTSAQTTAPEKESMPETTTVPPSSAETTSSAPDKANLSATLETYSSNKISIQYPVISNSSSPKEAEINTLLKTNALSILEAWEIDEEKDLLSIECNVISADRKRITATYTGNFHADTAPHPTNVFYTNTIDISAGKNLELNDYADAYTMAGYVMSDDCQLYQVSSELEKEILSYKNTQSIDSYTDLFNHADFPLEKNDNQKVIFPESFSYENQGIIYLSIPVPHALGDYVLVKFSPDTK